MNKHNYSCLGILKNNLNLKKLLSLNNFDNLIITEDDAYTLKDNFIRSLYLTYKALSKIVGFTEFKNRLYILDELSQIVYLNGKENISCKNYQELSNIGSTELFLILIEKQKVVYIIQNKENKLENYYRKFDLPANIREISYGKEHVIFLLANNKIFTYGNNSHGQLGIGDCNKYIAPQEVYALSGINVVKVSAGGWHNCALTRSGDIYLWGWNESAQLGLPYDCQFCDNISHDDLKFNIQCLPHPIIMGSEDIIIKAIACGSRHTICLTENGDLYGCGWNKYGQLGIPQTIKKVQTFSKITGLRDSSILQIYAGGWSSIIKWEQ